MLPDLIVAATVEMDPDKVRPGWVALGLVFLLIVILALLFFSFARHVRKAKEPWDGDPVTTEDSSDDSAATAERSGEDSAPMTDHSGEDSAPRSDDT